MALKLSTLEQSEGNPKGAKETMAGVGALNLSVRDETELAKTYVGKGAMLELAFTGIPGLRGPIKTLIKFGGNISPIVRRQLLKLEIWQDTEPLFDRYLVRVWYAGDSSIPEEGIQGSFSKD
ncbi:hypothetical protein LCGC14_2578360, partial [marine sediment metagenome]